MSASPTEEDATGSSITLSTDSPYMLLNESLSTLLNESPPTLSDTVESATGSSVTLAHDSPYTFSDTGDDATGSTITLTNEDDVTDATMSTLTSTTSQKEWAQYENLDRTQLYTDFDYAADERESLRSVFFNGGECHPLDRSNASEVRKAIEQGGDYLQFRALVRAGDIARRVFNLFRRHVFSLRVNHVQCEGDHMLLYRSSRIDPAGLGPLRLLDDCIVPFPDLFLDEERDRQALLALLASGDVLAYISPLISLMLKDICCDTDTDLLEIFIAPKGHKRRFTVVHPFGEPLPRHTSKHWVLRVRLRGGLYYAFDVSGAQFGHDETVMSWHLYAQTRIDQVVAHQSFGTLRQHGFRFAREKGHKGAILAMKKVWSRKLEEMLERIKPELGLSNILLYPEDEYGVLSEHFLELITMEFSVCQDSMADRPLSINPYVLKELVETTDPEVDECRAEEFYVTPDMLCH